MLCYRKLRGQEKLFVPTKTGGEYRCFTGFKERVVGRKMLCIETTKVLIWNDNTEVFFPVICTLVILVALQSRKGFLGDARHSVQLEIILQTKEMIRVSAFFSPNAFIRMNILCL